MFPRHPLAAVCALALAATAAHAQVSASLSGRIADPSGAAVPNAQVTLTETATHIHQQIPSHRRRRLPLHATQPRHLPARRHRPRLRAPHPHRRHRHHRPDRHRSTSPSSSATTRQTVTVNGDAPLLQAAQSDIETHIPGPTVLAIPLNSRNFINLAQLAPGVALPPGTVLPRINGGRPRTNEYLYDGISALQPEPGQVAFFPILDDIAEFTIQADNVPAEFGRFNGGVVNVATRAGSNPSTAPSSSSSATKTSTPATTSPPDGAASPSTAATSTAPPSAAPSSPTNHLFFFADYQGIKALIGRPVTSTVPTLLERQGIFTGVAKIYNPATTATHRPRHPHRVPQRRHQHPPRPRRRRPPRPLSPSPPPPAPPTTTAAPPTTPTTRTSSTSASTAPSAHRDRAFGRYSYFSDVEQPVTPFPDGSGAIAGTAIGTGGVLGLSHVLGQQAVFNETHTFTPRLVNDARVGYTRRGNGIAGPTLGTTASAALGIPGIPTNAAFNNALPLFTLTGFQQLGPSASTFAQYQTAVWEFVDTASYTRGRHAFKFGLDYRWYQLNTISPPNPTGSFAFTTTGTDTQIRRRHHHHRRQRPRQLPPRPGRHLLHRPPNLQAPPPRPHPGVLRSRTTGAPPPRLTFNLGARYTLHFPSTEKNNQGAVFDLPTQQLLFAGSTLGSNSARTLHYDNVAPRIGLNYLITPQTVVRAGFGIVFIDQSGITTPFTLPQFPFIQNVAQRTQDSINAAFKLSNGPTVAPIAINAHAGLGQSVYTVNRNAGSGYVQQWNLAFQRTVTRNLSFDIAYVGSHIVHVGIPDSNLNQLTAGPARHRPHQPHRPHRQGHQPLLRPAPRRQHPQHPHHRRRPAPQALPPLPERRHLPQQLRHRQLQRHRSQGRAAPLPRRLPPLRLHPLQAHRRRLLRLLLHRPLLPQHQLPHRRRHLHAPPRARLLQRRHPQRHHRRPHLRAPRRPRSPPRLLLRRQRRPRRLVPNAIAIAQSGMPVTVTQATNNNSFAGFVLQRPNLVGNPQLYGDARSPLPYFNTAAFATAPTFTLGNSSRNPVRGPAYRDLDFALVKLTQLLRAQLPRAPRRALQPHQHPRLRPAQRQLRRRRLRHHHHHHRRAARNPVRPPPKPLNRTGTSAASDHSHPERNLARSLRQVESKDLRLAGVPHNLLEPVTSSSFLERRSTHRHPCPIHRAVRDEWAHPMLTLPAPFRPFLSTHPSR